jgi:hypothetical protein
MNEQKLTLIPNYLIAKTPELLRASMLNNNLQKNIKFDYQDISELKNGSFICWYYEEIDLDKLLKRAKGG